MKKVCITGGNGYLGRNLIDFLNTKGDFDIHCIVRKSYNNIPNNVKIHSQLPDFGVDLFFHIAGNPSSTSCIENPRDAFDKNTAFTFEVLEYCRTYKPIMIYFSSMECYYPINMYAATKLSGEHMCMAYNHSYKCNNYVIRIPNTFGNYCQKERFPNVILRSILNKLPITINTTEGKVGVRNWLPVNHLLDMIFYIINNKLDNTIIYNTVGEKLSNVEFVEKFFNIMSKKTNLIFNDMSELNTHTSLLQIATNNIPGWKQPTSFDLELKNFIVISEITNMFVT